MKGLVFTVPKALPLLPEGASIILTSSVVGSKGLPANSVYAASKAAIRSFARTWTTDLKARKIRVNAISPGATDTEGFRDLVGSDQAGQDRVKGLSSVVPMDGLVRSTRFANLSESAQALILRNTSSGRDERNHEFDDVHPTNNL